VSGQVSNVVAFPSRRPERPLKLAEIIDLYGFSPRWWRYRAAEGLPRHRWGGQWRYYPSEVEEWMERRSRS
jgi:predicted DNA-binding transcriptional regulator AlpA